MWIDEANYLGARVTVICVFISKNAVSWLPQPDR